nr:MAG TPA: hypothetical protein [Caudoviricetes sp.]
MCPSSHLLGAPSARRTPGPTSHTGPTAASETRPSKCDNRHKLYFPGLLESLSRVMYLTL